MSPTEGVLILLPVGVLVLTDMLHIMLGRVAKKERGNGVSL